MHILRIGSRLRFISRSQLAVIQFSSSTSTLSGESNNFSLESFIKNLEMNRQRWFTNPYADYEEGKTNLQINTEKVKSEGLQFLETALRKGAKDGDGGLYVGAGGIAYAFHHVSHILTPEEKQKLFPLAYSAFQKQSMHYQTHPSGKTDECGFLLGKGGFYALAAVWGHETENNKLLEESMAKYIQAAEYCKPLNFFKNGGDELFVGRAGYLFGALWLQERLKVMPVPREDLLDIWNAIIESGQNYSKQRKSPSPLMYSYYDTEYLGAAHGLCAILQVLLSFPGFMRENPTSERLIKDSIDFYLTLQDSSGNFPCAMDEIGKRRDSDALLHWCHGAPGAVYLFAKSYLHYKDKKYLDACIKCGDAVWDKGLLRKGPGICHGVAGSGYVFLVIYNLLEQKDPKHLYRALSFSQFLQDPHFQKDARRPDCPYSLYEGTAGTACFVLDLLQPEKAQFPFFNIYNNYV